MADKTKGFKSKLDRVVSKVKLQRKPKPQHAEHGTTVSSNMLELLITTVARSKGEYYADLLQSFDVNMQFMALGNGTADAKMLSMFGLQPDSEKSVIFSIIQGDRLPAALAALDEKFRTIKNGKGIAYTVPLTGVIGKLIFGFLSDNRMMSADGVAPDKENKQ